MNVCITVTKFPNVSIFTLGYFHEVKVPVYDLSFKILIDNRQIHQIRDFRVTAELIEPTGDSQSTTVVTEKIIFLAPEQQQSLENKIQMYNSINRSTYLK